MKTHVHKKDLYKNVQDIFIHNSAKKWKYSQCPLTGKWINTLWYICTVQCWQLFQHRGKLAQVPHGGVVMKDRTTVIGRLAGAAGSASKMVHSSGCWQEASVPCHMVPSKMLLECPYDMATDFCCWVTCCGLAWLQVAACLEAFLVNVGPKAPNKKVWNADTTRVTLKCAMLVEQPDTKGYLRYDFIPFIWYYKRQNKSAVFIKSQTVVAWGQG